MTTVLNTVKEIVNEATDIKTMKSLAKIGDRAVKVAKYAPHDNTALLESAKCLSFVNSFFTIHTGYLSAKTVYKNIKNHSQLKGIDRTINDLGIISGLTGTASGVMSSFTVVETLMEWARAGANMGRTALSATSAFGMAGSIIHIVHLTIEIGIAALKLYQLEKKVERTKNKVSLWQGNIDTTFIQNRVDHIQDKQNHLIVKMNAAEQRISNSHHRVPNSIQNLHHKKNVLHNKKGLRKAAAWISYKNCKRKHAHIIAKQAKEQAAFDQLNQKHMNNTKKIAHWNHLGTRLDDLSDDEHQTLNQFKISKQIKWRRKKSNLKLEQWKTTLGIALKVAILTVLIASFVLSIMGGGPLPVFITLASVGLFLSVASLGIDWYKKYRKPKKINPVTVPQLASNCLNSSTCFTPSFSASCKG